MRVNHAMVSCLWPGSQAGGGPSQTSVTQKAGGTQRTPTQSQVRMWETQTIPRWSRTRQSLFVLSKCTCLCVLKGVYLRDTGDSDPEAPPHLCITPLWTGLTPIHLSVCLCPASLRVSSFKFDSLNLSARSVLSSQPDSSFLSPLSLQTLSWGSSQGQ